MRLLAINLWDKYAEARRWIDEAGRWLPGWSVRVDCNGDPSQTFAAETRRFPNRGGILGTYDSYRFEVPDGCEVVASVHAKCWLSDPSVIDRIADQMLGRGSDAAIVPSPHFHHGMNLHLFLMTGDAWRRFSAELPDETSRWPEEVVRDAIEATCSDVMEVHAGRWQYLPDDAPPNFNDEGGRVANGYQISYLSNEPASRLVSTEITGHPARRR